jgi:hypothetical protein
MTKLFSILLFISFSTVAIAQTDSAKTKCKLNPYASIGLSIGHVDPSDPNIDNFNKAAFPSIEAGVMGENVSLGAVFGYENFFAVSSARKFYELKTSVFKSLGKSTSVYGLFGAGAYFENAFNPFIEYGAGFSYMPDKLGYFVQYSNWSRTNYVSIGATYVF